MISNTGFATGCGAVLEHQDLRQPAERILAAENSGRERLVDDGEPARTVHFGRP